VLKSLLIHPDRSIDKPRQVKEATYKLNFKNAPKVDRAQFARTPAQKVKWLNDRTLQITVQTNAVGAEDQQPGEKFTASSTMLDADHPKVQQLVEEALGSQRESLSDREKAQKLRRFVYQYITQKDLSIGLATASEVAETGQGDCTEHAVLLAAMLRACDIPSRIANGLIYANHFAGADDIFGYHMWTQAWLPSAAEEGVGWVDLDAAAPGHAMGFDATHITLSTTSLSGSSVTNELIKSSPVFGQLDIEIVETK
jgi:transglutaminase-like putative cysteine protease